MIQLSAEIREIFADEAKLAEPIEVHVLFYNAYRNAPIREMSFCSSSLTE